MLIVHMAKLEKKSWSMQMRTKRHFGNTNLSESGTSALDVENMVGAALGDISMGISASDHSADESMNHDERIKVSELRR